MDAWQEFQQFFDDCVGQWTTERTYHYLTHQEVERSPTEFTIHPIQPELKAKVLTDNQLENRELLMTTTYTHVVFVDSITLINPHLRIRRILNYRRPAEGEPLQEVVLVGFGIEQKQEC